MGIISQLSPEELPTCDRCFATPIEDILTAGKGDSSALLRDMFLIRDEEGMTITVCSRCKESEVEIAHV